MGNHERMFFLVEIETMSLRHLISALVRLAVTQRGGSLPLLLYTKRGPYANEPPRCQFALMTLFSFHIDSLGCLSSICFPVGLTFYTNAIIYIYKNINNTVYTMTININIGFLKPSSPDSL